MFHPPLKSLLVPLLCYTHVCIVRALLSSHCSFPTVGNRVVLEKAPSQGTRLVSWSSPHHPSAVHLDAEAGVRKKSMTEAKPGPVLPTASQADGQEERIRKGRKGPSPTTACGTKKRPTALLQAGEGHQVNSGHSARQRGQDSVLMDCPQSPNLPQGPGSKGSSTNVWPPVQT